MTCAMLCGPSSPATTPSGWSRRTDTAAQPRCASPGRRRPSSAPHNATYCPDSRVRYNRWPDGVCCPACASAAVIRDACDDRQRSRQRYRCKTCSGRFDDLTGTVLAGHHQPLRVWVLCLYFMGLNLSNRQIAQELGLEGSDAQAMTEQLRRGLVAKIAPVRLEGEVEIDEVYVVAGHKGQPAAVAKGGGSDAAAGWRERRDAARWRRTSRRSWA